MPPFGASVVFPSGVGRPRDAGPHGLFTTPPLTCLNARGTQCESSVTRAYKQNIRQFSLSFLSVTQRWLILPLHTFSTNCLDAPSAAAPPLHMAGVTLVRYMQWLSTKVNTNYDCQHPWGREKKYSVPLLLDATFGCHDVHNATAQNTLLAEQLCRQWLAHLQDGAGCPLQMLQDQSPRLDQSKCDVSATMRLDFKSACWTESPASGTAAPMQ